MDFRRRISNILPGGILYLRPGNVTKLNVLFLHTDRQLKLNLRRSSSVMRDEEGSQETPSKYPPVGLLWLLKIKSPQNILRLT